MGADSDRPPGPDPWSPRPSTVRCPLPDSAPAWGWAAQLYAARSSRSWGIGDLADLDALGRWAASLGAGFILVNPLHAAAPTLSQHPSPYFPSTRRFRNPLYLRVEDVPGAGPQVEQAAKAGRALNDRRLIDRDAVFRIKLEALEGLWAAFAGDDAFDRFVDEQGDALQEWGVYCALAERHGGDWRRWPAELRRPDRAAVRRAAGEGRDRVRFHQWLQWLVDEQLAAASKHVAVMHDLAVGFAPGGADAWAWQDLLAPGMALGVPPDEFNTQGQVWGLPPFDPWKLRAVEYRPFVETIRASVRHAGAIRIDHALGLARMFWVPDGAPPSKGVYVRYPYADLLDVIAQESERAGSFVVGEDLGTSTPEILEALASRRLLSYRLLWFEETPPSEFPAQAMAAVTTHDLPTVAGLWTGSDMRTQQELGLKPNVEGWEELRDRLCSQLGLGADTPPRDVIVAVHRALADAPSMLVAATLDDAVGVAERPNMPGTTDEWPNWSLALPLPLEALMEHPLAGRLAEALQRRGGR